MEATLGILLFFGTPLFIAHRYFKLREKQLEAGRSDGKLLQGADAERAKLEARIQNLESIVCSVDFELNQRLNRLAGEHSLRLQEGKAAGHAPGLAAAAAPTAALAATQALTPTGRLALGQVLADRYTIERELGHGGMGAVYLARDAKLGERVALKTILSTLAGDTRDLIDRFRREVQAARKVTHPNVIRIHDLGEEGPLLFLSMEYIEGETLFDYVRRAGPPSVSEARELLGAVADGVAAAHRAGIVHRDLKPQNVLLGRDPARVIKVIDFGLAQTSFTAGLTATGMILGTPEYMAPEQIRGGRCDARTDVYALGATAYYVLCGRPPFAGPTPIAIGFAHVNEPPKPPRALRPEIPEPLEQAILAALAKDPGDRPVDAATLATALAA
jgi:serine/threonine-protein kinase